MIKIIEDLTSITEQQTKTLDNIMKFNQLIFEEILRLKERITLLEDKINGQN